MAARKVSVTSVTPASKVKATSKAQQSRTRNLVMGIAAATPVGRVAKVASVAAKPLAAAARNAAGKKVVSATMGKAAAEKYATAAAKRTAQRTQTASDLKNTKTLATPSKASVKVKPAAKQVGNRPNPTKADEEMISSVSRGGIGRGSLGKGKTARTFNSSANKSKPDARTPARTPEQGERGAFSYNTVKINSQRNLKKR